MATTTHRSTSKSLPPGPSQTIPNRLWLAYDSLILSLQAARRTPGTVRFYHDYLRPFVAWIEGQSLKDVTEITATHIRTYLLAKEEAGLSPQTVHHSAQTIKRFCNFLVEEDLLQISPFRRVKMPKVPQVLQPALTREEAQRILAACNGPQDTAVILFLLDTGVRRDEFLALNIGDVDFKSGVVRIRSGKGGKGRTVYLGARARKALNRYLMERGPVGLGEPLWVLKTEDHHLADERMTRSALRFLLKRLGDKAEVQNCHAHTFRHTFATWSLRAGINIYALQALMGHSDLQMLRKYLNLADEDIQDASRRFGAVDSTL